MLLNLEVINLLSWGQKIIWQSSVLSGTVYWRFYHFLVKINSLVFAFCVFSYEEARDMLINEEILAPVYYIIGGTKSGQVKTMSHLLPVMSDFILLVLSLNNTQILTWTHRRITILLSSICYSWCTGIFLHLEQIQ